MKNNLPSPVRAKDTNDGPRPSTSPTGAIHPDEHHPPQSPVRAKNTNDGPRPSISPTGATTTPHPLNPIL